MLLAMIWHVITADHASWLSAAVERNSVAEIVLLRELVHHGALVRVVIEQPSFWFVPPARNPLEVLPLDAYQPRRPAAARCVDRAFVIQVGNAGG